MDAILATVKEAAAKEKILLAGTWRGIHRGDHRAHEARRGVWLSRGAGETAALLQTGLQTRALIAHFRRVADESPIPVMLYSIPQFTGITLSTAEVAALAEHPNIIGIKDSSGMYRAPGILSPRRRPRSTFW